MGSVTDLPPHTLSVAIITKNEEGNLARTLASVQFADEIIVLDSASTDRTVEIARSFNAKVYDEPWKGFRRLQELRHRQVHRQRGCFRSTPMRSSAPSCSARSATLLPTNPPPTPTISAAATSSSAAGSSMAAFIPTPKLRLFRRKAANFAAPPQF